MAKKKRRARHRRTTRPQYSPSPTAAEQGAEPSAKSGKNQGNGTSNPGKQVDFSTEYRYVVNDLRSMAVIAASMLVVLIALSFVIH
ncbi:MAG: hypothetical protein P8186_29785 [Anaerolineae bacterium]|jgi:hypothetical protein